MEIDEIEQLVSIVREAKISELTVSFDGSTVKLRKRLPGGASLKPVLSYETERSAGPESVAPEDKASAEVSTVSDLVITAPMVGILHRIDGVDVGTTVSTGQPVCAIESMKLMNDIISEHEGVIAEMLVDDGVPVEYGQPLFRLETV